MSKPRVAVLGAGPAGMTAAWQLSKRGYPVTVFDRDNAVGGMARTITMSPAGTSSISGRIRSTFARPMRVARCLGRSNHFSANDPLILTRGTRVLLRGKEYVYPLELLQVLTGVSPVFSARIVFDYLMATMKTTFSAPQERGLVRGMGGSQPRSHALRPVLRDLLGACLGLADESDLVEAGAAGREAESEEHRPSGPRDQGRSGNVLHQVHVPAQGHQPALRGDGRRRAQSGGRDQARSARGSAGAARRRHSPGVLSRGRQRANADDYDLVLSTLPLPALVGMMSRRCHRPSSSTRRSCAIAA